MYRNKHEMIFKRNSTVTRLCVYSVFISLPACRREDGQWEWNVREWVCFWWCSSLLSTTRWALYYSLTTNILHYNQFTLKFLSFILVKSTKVPFRTCVQFLLYLDQILYRIPLLIEKSGFKYTTKTSHCKFKRMTVDDPELRWIEMNYNHLLWIYRELVWIFSTLQMI